MPKIKNCSNFEVVAELAGQFPGDSLLGDSFGGSLILNKNELIIGAVFSTVQSMPDAGATYFYKPNKEGVWTQFQNVFTLPFSFNEISGGALASKDEWLFVPAPGTPLDVSDTTDQKDRSGSLLIFKKIKDEWALVQTLLNPKGTVNGSQELFGLNVDYSGGDWVVVSGSNISEAYLYKFDKSSGLWNLKQTIETGTFKGNIIASINGKYAFIQKPIDFNNVTNQTVLVYKRNKYDVWIQTQILEGFDNPVAPGSFGDLFGSPSIIRDKDAIIGAPGDSKFGLSSGASYFLRLSKGKWKITQKVYSDQPTVFFGVGNTLRGKTAIIGDPGRVVGNNQYQGAIIIYKKKKNKWFPKCLLVDPNGRSFDYFGSGGINLNKKYLAAAPFRGSPFNFPNPIIPADVLNGRVVVWKKKDSK